MIKIDDVIVSDEVLEKKFICDINSAVDRVRRVGTGKSARLRHRVFFCRRADYIYMI